MPEVRKRGKKPGGRFGTTPLYILLAVLFVLYLYFQGVQFLALLFGLMLFIVFVILVVSEFAASVSEEGMWRSVAEIAVAIGLVFVLWVAASALLHTSSPLNVVPSCSMLPHLNRGDVILLQGVTNINQVHAPVVSVSNASYARMLSGIGGEFLACVAYSNSTGRVVTSQILKQGYSVGLYNQVSGTIVPTFSQAGNLVQYTCGTGQVTFANGSVATEVYTTAISIGGTVIIGDRNNSIGVYQTAPSDLFYKLGDSYVVHRVYAVINASGSYYLLMKGDNNPGLDLQYGNYPVNMSRLQGTMLASVPYVGYVKLIFSNSFTEPAGCNATLSN